MSLEATSPMGLLLGKQVIIVGVETGTLPCGLTKIYFTQRSLGMHVIVNQEAGREAVLGWNTSTHLVMETPLPDRVFFDSDGEPDIFGRID